MLRQNGMNWLWSDAVGGVKLQVKNPDVQRARQLLQQKPEDREGHEDTVDETPDAPRCALCNSPDVHFEKFSRPLAFLPVLFLGFPIPFLKPRWRCASCGHKWKAK